MRSFSIQPLSQQPRHFNATFYHNGRRLSPKAAFELLNSTEQAEAIYRGKLAYLLIFSTYKRPDSKTAAAIAKRFDFSGSYFSDLLSGYKTTESLLAEHVISQFNLPTDKWNTLVREIEKLGGIEFLDNAINGLLSATINIMPQRFIEHYGGGIELRTIIQRHRSRNTSPEAIKASFPLQILAIIIQDRGRPAATLPIAEVLSEFAQYAQGTAATAQAA